MEIKKTLLSAAIGAVLFGGIEMLVAPESTSLLPELAGAVTGAALATRNKVNNTIA